MPLQSPNSSKAQKNTVPKLVITQETSLKSRILITIITAVSASAIVRLRFRTTQKYNNMHREQMTRAADDDDGKDEGDACHDDDDDDVKACEEEKRYSNDDRSPDDDDNDNEDVTNDNDNDADHRSVVTVDQVVGRGRNGKP